MKEVTVRPLQAEDIPAVLAISQTEFGSDYQTAAEFRELLTAPDRFCLVAVGPDGPAAFAYATAFGPEAVDRVLRLPASAARDRLLTVGRIGLLDGLAVRDDCKGHGAGTALAEAVQTELGRRGCAVMVLMAWKRTDGITNIRPLAEHVLGMHAELEVPGYWNGQVPSGAHHCPLCGAPCRCSAVLYGRDLPVQL